MPLNTMIFLMSHMRIRACLTGQEAVALAERSFRILP